MLAQGGAARLAHSAGGAPKINEEVKRVRDLQVRLAHSAGMGGKQGRWRGRACNAAGAGAAAPHPTPHRAGGAAF